MNRFYGNVGYVEYNEVEPGMFVEKIVERPYYGDVNRIVSHWQGTENLTDDVKLNNEISIVADPYALDHFNNIRYVVFNNSKWKVSAITVNFPRIALNIGGLYHEQENNTTSNP